MVVMESGNHDLFILLEYMFLCSADSYGKQTSPWSCHRLLYNSQTSNMRVKMGVNLLLTNVAPMLAIMNDLNGSLLDKYLCIYTLMSE